MARTLPSLEQRLQRPVGLEGLVEVGRQRLVQDQQVDLVDAELAGALVEAVQRLVVAVVADPDLGLQEDLPRGDACERVHRFADLALVAVGGGRVDVAVAGVERGRDRAARVSSGGVWKTPRPMAGISTPLFSMSDAMWSSLSGDLGLLGGPASTSFPCCPDNLETARDEAPW